jgi:hypothetical protein
MDMRLHSQHIVLVQLSERTLAERMKIELSVFFKNYTVPKSICLMQQVSYDRVVHPAFPPCSVFN